MFHLSVWSSSRIVLILFTLSLAIGAVGCADTSGVGPTFPVSGKATVNDTPLTAKSTVIVFKPDASRGNTSSFEPTGTVDAEGVYTLKTQGKSGAPPGWYKVIVTAREETEPTHPKGPNQQRPVAKSLLHAKYGQAEYSGLSIEVLEKPAPGAYDLKLNN
ncbi:MAG TPA: hypothetical protein VH592_27000 [Gemmataceae bacterium]